MGGYYETTTAMITFNCCTHPPLFTFNNFSMKSHCFLTLLLFTVVACNNRLQQEQQDANKLSPEDSTKLVKTASNVLTAADTLDFNAFKQGYVRDGIFFKGIHWSAGNCASTALVKCAIATFGIGKVFPQVDTLDDSYKVHLFNGDSVTVYKSNLATIVPHRVGWILYQGDSAADAILSYGYLCFSVMAIENDERGRWRFPREVDELDKGYDASMIYELLGLKSVPVKVSDLAQTRNAVMYNSCHCVYTSMGFFDEENLSHAISPVDSFAIWHSRTRYPDPISGAYTLQQ